jgi:hypothetical protein
VLTTHAQYPSNGQALLAQYAQGMYMAELVRAILAQEQQQQQQQQQQHPALAAAFAGAMPLQGLQHIAASSAVLNSESLPTSKAAPYQQPRPAEPTAQQGLKRPVPEFRPRPLRDAFVFKSVIECGLVEDAPDGSSKRVMSAHSDFFGKQVEVFTVCGDRRAPARANVIMLAHSGGRRS